MRPHIEKIILAAIFVCLVSGVGISQQKPESSDTSLGETARKLKAQKPKEPKPTRVFTNDNLIPADSDSKLAVGPTEKKTPDDKPSGDKKKSDTPHDETYFRTRSSELKDKLDIHTRELNVLQRKLGENQTQYYPDPNKTLQQEYSRKDINTLGADIEAKKQQIADDQKAIDDLHEQLRHESGDPAWLR